MYSLLIIVAGLSWGMLGIFLRQLSFAGLNALEVCAIRGLGTVAILGIALACWQPKLFRIRWRDCWCFIGGGCVSVLLFNYCYFLTLQRTSIGIAVTLLYTSPVFVAILSRLFFKEPFTWQKTLAVMLMLAGCALVSGVFDGQLTLTPAGLATGLASGLCYGLYSIFGRYAQQHGYQTATITFWNFFFSALASCALPRWGFVAHAFADHPAIWLWGLALVGISTILPYCCYTAGLAHMEASRAAVLVAIEPLVATMAGIVFYHERITLAASCGIFLVLAAILVLQWRQRPAGNAIDS